ncbi:hypothetical protein GT037_002889 [Alternaria burnsii]|uniref:Uncharacterized protein n=1 Tax=Alternaria burnsii TaxID=1187904 RepID=A0A8H7B8A4_9PLEO|nr:uncharacterized protein GT037_002889 [Alternaria burnsii]KAF7679141.1 hypothetical protein GT037_002889 [Alternaria burnsii]
MLACLTWLAGEGSAQRLLTVLASYIIDSTPAASKRSLPGRSGRGWPPSSGPDDDRGDWSRGLHDLRHVGRRAEADRRQSILGDIGWGYGIPYCGTQGTASSNAMLRTRGDGAKKQRVTLLQTHPGWDLRGETQLLLFCILVISSQV